MRMDKYWLFSALLVVAFVQLSCSEFEFYDDRTDRQRDKDACEERGGIWHDYPVAYCELPSTFAKPSPTNQEPPATSEPTTQSDKPFDLNQCDAGAVVNVAPTLDEDRLVQGGRSCFYTQNTTNNSDQPVIFYYHDVRSTQDPSWVSVLLDPWETHTYIGYLSNTDYGGLTYAYIDKVAAMYYSDACKEEVNSLDTATAAELFDYEPLSYCNP
jgi:hypothetical protein